MEDYKIAIEVAKRKRRDEFAKAALTGVASNFDRFNIHDHHIAATAVRLADETIAQLDQP